MTEDYKKMWYELKSTLSNMEENGNLMQQCIANSFLTLVNNIENINKETHDDRNRRKIIT